MRALFREIRAGGVDAVRSRLDADPALVHAIAKGPPKKDDGQSPLQVAIKSGQFEVAHLLIDRGADVSFIEASEVNGWNSPVLHDAVRAAVFSARFGRNWALPGEPPKIELVNSEERFGRALSVLSRLLEEGADPNVRDSLGNPALVRAALDARQVVSEPVGPELRHDLGQVFTALVGAGADTEWVDPRTQRTAAQVLAGTAVRDLLP